ncbi:hypothetical protein [Spongiactinospora sp. TRM90649]|uniref:hypothetical protein n=1 Tax=Spongiactinospora sp. TRM90649 TaxID=3031114 RepID=UPI0023F6F1AF|nr:hypothetical protein [Spongiactinospora sp. TRM90649]MDF5758611.1 hypothetical protein [Spongiactinospora sp. TRM90649]
MSAVVGLLEIDAGDAPMFTVAVDPSAPDTAMTAEIVETAAAISMTPSADRATWSGTGPALTVPGEYTARFTATGTGAGVQYFTVIVASPPPLTTDLRRLRLLIADTDPSARIFRVDELDDFLALEGSVKLAAAQALDVIASSEALVSKKIRTQEGMQTDGPAVAAELRARAMELRRQATEGEGDDSVGFDIVDFADPFTRRAELAE